METNLPIHGFMVELENYKQFIELWDIMKRGGKTEDGELLFDGGVYIYFSAPWCKSCKKLKPEFNQISELFENPDNKQYQVLYVDDVQKNEFPSGFCEIRKLPSLIKIENGITEIYKGHQEIESWIHEKLD
jgi:thiol-disulfide isomerase/thioredoxin